jgi:hypothetical protein
MVVTGWGHSHTARASVEVLRHIFPNPVICHGGDIPWAVKSPDLIILYVTSFCGVITKVKCTPGDMLADFHDIVEECLRKGGSQLTNRVFKNELIICVCKMLLCIAYIMHVEW